MKKLFALLLVLVMVIAIVPAAAAAAEAEGTGTSEGTGTGAPAGTGTGTSEGTGNGTSEGTGTGTSEGTGTGTGTSEGTGTGTSEPCKHEHTSWIVDDQSHAEYCDDCNKTISAYEPHTYDSTHHCTVCGRPEPNPECAHKNIAYSPAGSEGHVKYCSDCFADLSDIEPHHRVGNVCDLCGFFLREIHLIQNAVIGRVDLPGPQAPAVRVVRCKQQPVRAEPAQERTGPGDAVYPDVIGQDRGQIHIAGKGMGVNLF